jgi:hypothetical protein
MSSELESDPLSGRSVSDWPAATVAIGILALLGAVLVTATIRWPAADVKSLFGDLSPVLGVVTGAFVTYFFTRQATATAVRAATTTAASAAEAARATAASAAEATEKQATMQAALLDAQTTRVENLSKALTAAFGLVSERTAMKLRQDRTIGKVV